MYKIIGGDTQEYGPITDADLRKWIAEGRLNLHSLAKSESDDAFRPLSTFPEFSDAIGIVAPVSGAARASFLAVDWSNRDYELDIGGCFSRGWKLFANNLGILAGGAAIMVVLILTVSLLVGAISKPVLTNAFSMETRLSPAFQIIQNYVIKVVIALVIGPLFGGLYFLFIQCMRGQRPGVGGLFIGFQRAFGQLFVGYVVITLALAVCFLPFSIVELPRFAPLLALFEQAKGTMTPDQMHEKIQQILPQMVSGLAAGIPVFLLCLIPWFYLFTNFQFVLLLIVDKEINFWTAIKTSWKMAHKHWFTVFGLTFLSQIIFFSGAFLCCIGLPFTIAISTAAIVFGYETIFGQSRAFF